METMETMEMEIGGKSFQVIDIHTNKFRILLLFGWKFEL